MAQLKLKQLDSVLTGSLVISGSHSITGSLYVSESIYGDGLVLGEEAYSLGTNYVGLKTTHQTGSNDYMIISGKSDGSTYISAKDGEEVEIRGGGNRSNNSIIIPDNTFIKLGGSATTLLRPESDNTTDLGSSTLRYKDIHLSGDISGSTATGSFGKLLGDGSSLTGVSAGVFAKTGSFYAATQDLKVSGSLNVSESINISLVDSGSTAIYSNNIQNGYPTSNQWQSNLVGSYFNNFDNTTHVSEILRFMAGIISHSIDTASPTANTKTFASVDTNNNNLGSTASQIAGRLPQNYTSLSNTTLNYLVHKDWTGVGEKIFDGITFYASNGPTYYVDFDSNSGGSTSVQSSADSELFGLGGLTSGGATRFDVRVIATQSFSDTGSVATPTTASNTFTTQSYIDYTMTDFGTTSGVELAKIASANPAVIPAAYQDGKFENLGGTSMTGSLTRRYSGSNPSLNNDFTSVSASGYYNFHGLKVGIATGSGAFTYVNGTDKKYFFAPRSTINTAIGDNSLADVGTTTRYLTCVSRSLSGAPYVTGSTYEISTKITGLFNPLYAATTTLTDMNGGSVGVGSVSITNDNISTSGGTIQTANAIYDSGGSSARSTSTVPYYNDIAIVSASVLFAAGNDENIQSSATLTDETFTVQTRARDRDSDYSTLDTQTIYYHSASMFGQPHTSGSMGVYGRAQGYDGGTLAGTTETFTGESYRIQLADNVQAFNGTAWTTTFAINQLGNYDLQVKPGFLVDPGGSYRYWYPSSYGSGTYKYYIRRFQTDGGTKSSMTVNLNNNTLIAWNATTNGVSCALLFESSGKNSGNNSALGVARIYDPTATTSNLIEADIAQDNFKNPFSTAISLYGNSGGSIGSNTYTVPIRNADGMYLDSNDNELYVIVRYKGDPTPIDDITLTFS
jgi:hypothetical protein